MRTPDLAGISGVVDASLNTVHSVWSPVMSGLAPPAATGAPSGAAIPIHAPQPAVSHGTTENTRKRDESVTAAPASMSPGTYSEPNSAIATRVSPATVPEIQRPPANAANFPEPRGYSNPIVRCWLLNANCPWFEMASDSEFASSQPLRVVIIHHGTLASVPAGAA